MTKSLRGSSLPQARSYHHNHYHLHNKRAASHENAIPHQHHRRQTDTDEADNSPTPESASSSSSSSRKVVVQTVSIVQVVDASGAPIEVQTHYAPPATVDADTHHLLRNCDLLERLIPVDSPGDDLLNDTIARGLFHKSRYSLDVQSFILSTGIVCGAVSLFFVDIPYVNKFIFYISPYRNHFNKPVFVRFDERNIFSAFIHFIDFRFIF
ncbi:hypothetical protein K4K59_012895 [Colletotrichum sp. SAR11_240]|nr:hypothetical protein K4K59_012895 [Colletotrichum sp. SAR11_240]